MARRKNSLPVVPAKARVNRESCFIRCGSFRITPDELLDYELMGLIDRAAVTLFNHIQRFVAILGRDIGFRELHRMLNEKRPADAPKVSESSLAKWLDMLEKCKAIERVPETGHYAVNFNMYSATVSASKIEARASKIEADTSKIEARASKIEADASKIEALQPQNAQGELRDSIDLRDSEPRNALHAAAQLAAAAKPAPAPISEFSETRSAPKTPQTAAELAIQLEQERESARQALLKAGFRSPLIEDLLHKYHPARLITSLAFPESPLSVKEIREHLHARAGTLPAQG